jgi:hypothetical protein
MLFNSKRNKTYSPDLNATNEKQKRKENYAERKMIKNTLSSGSDINLISNNGAA